MSATSNLARVVARRLAVLNLDTWEAERRGGFKRGFINDIFRGQKRSVLGANATKLAAVLQVPSAVILDPTAGLADPSLDLAGIEAQPPVEAPAKAAAHPEEASSLIPEIDVRGGAGFGGGAGLEAYVPDGQGGMATTDATRGSWMIPDYVLAGRAMHAGRTNILEVDGPSMIPDLYPTDRVVVDLDDTNPGRDGIFAVWDGDTQSVVLKNVQVVRGSDPPRIKCISSNKTYEPFEVILDGSSRIIGRLKFRITAV